MGQRPLRPESYESEDTEPETDRVGGKLRQRPEADGPMGPEATWARGQLGQKPMGPGTLSQRLMGTEATKVEARGRGRGQRPLETEVDGARSHRPEADGPEAT